jgi:pyruvate/2-oxoglutarate/acetoin dehydrogenase E1 component
MVVSEVCTTIFETLKEKPLNISAPDVPVPTSTSLSEKYYPNLSTIVDKILEYSGKSALGLPISFDSLHLPPKLKVMY